MELWERYFKVFKQRDSRCLIGLRLEELQNYFGGEIPENIQDEFFTEDYNAGRNLVLENLQTHDSAKLTSKAKSLFGSDLVDVEFPFREEEKSFIKFRFKDPYTLVRRSKELRALGNFFGYELSIQRGSTAELEPRYPEVRELGGQHGYHVFCNDTEPEHGISTLESIKQNGLRVKGGNLVRSYPKRVYAFFYNSVAEARKNLEQDAKELGWVDDVPNATVIQFRAPQKLTWYRDSVMKGPAYFTYQNIPPEFIEKVFDLHSF